MSVVGDTGTGSTKEAFNHSVFSRMSLEAASSSASPDSGLPKRGGSSIIEGHAQVALTEEFLVHNGRYSNLVTPNNSFI